MAGDLTIYGRRDRVAVIREKDGKRTILMHDLRSSDIFNSPCYYLQQNDIVYVEPNKAKAGQSGDQPEQVGGCVVCPPTSDPGFHRVSDCDINKVKKENL